MNQLTPPEPISNRVDLQAFSCGKESIDNWLRQKALSNQAQGLSATYIVCEAGVVVAYYSLSQHSLVRDELPNAKARQGMPAFIPATLLGQFGVTQDERFRGKGLGKSLARHALAKAYEASRIAASRMVVLDALDDQAKDFWERHLASGSSRISHISFF